MVRQRQTFWKYQYNTDKKSCLYLPFILHRRMWRNDAETRIQKVEWLAHISQTCAVTEMQALYGTLSSNKLPWIAFAHFSYAMEYLDVKYEWTVQPCLSSFRLLWCFFFYSGSVFCSSSATSGEECFVFTIHLNISLDRPTMGTFS